MLPEVQLSELTPKGPFGITDVTVRSAFPELVTVTVLVPEVCPTVTLPKSRLAGLKLMAAV
jgi:hypothetical protein